MCKIAPVTRQFLTIVACNLLTFGFGCSSGWASINFNDFIYTELNENSTSNELQTKDNDTFNNVQSKENSTFPINSMTLEEASLVVSIINVGGLIGNFAVLPLSQMIGVKRTIHLFGVPLILSIVLIIWAQNVYYLYVSRVMSGLVGGAVSVGIPTMISHISHDNVRGALNSLYDPLNNTGIILSFLLGNYMNWLDQAKIQLLIPIVFMIIMFLLPESPEFLTNRNKDKKAIKSHRFYKGSVAALEHAEFLEKKTGKMEKFEEDDSDCKISFRDFLTPHAKKAMFISITALTLNFSSCTIVILSYVNDIFTKTGSSLTPKSSSLLISITQIATNLVFLNIVERVNRRTLLITSAILTTISLCAFGVYCLFWIGQPEYEWVPTVIFPCVVFFSWIGMVPLPFICLIEFFPKKLLELGVAMAATLMWILFFIFNYIFPFLLESCGLFICMIGMAFLCLALGIFTMFYMPETRGKSYDDIVELLSK